MVEVQCFTLPFSKNEQMIQTNTPSICSWCAPSCQMLEPVVACECACACSYVWLLCAVGAMVSLGSISSLTEAQMPLLNIDVPHSWDHRGAHACQHTIASVSQVTQLQKHLLLIEPVFFLNIYVPLSGGVGVLFSVVIKETTGVNTCG